MESNCYPEIYLPEKIESILGSLPKLPPQPAEPKAPIMPTKPEEKENDKGTFGCILIFVVGVVIFCVSKGAFESFGDAMSIVPLLLIGLFSLVLIIQLPSKKKQYELDMQEYNQKLNQYNADLKNFETQKIKYQQDLANYNRKRKELLSKKNLSLYRSKLFNEVKNKISDDSAYKNTDKIKVGPGEDYFFPYLKKLCSDNFKIFRNIKVETPFDYYYYPDFVLVDDNGIIYDIEIDEPYSMEDKVPIPIHYLELEECELVSSDEYRNDFFTSVKGWVVIRFSEKEIYKDPEKCVNFIKEVYDGICNMDFSEVNSFEILREKKWTEAEACKMASRRYRESYIVCN